MDNIEKFLAEYGRYMSQALVLIDNMTVTINEVLELTYEEPAKEILRKQVENESDC